ncbi:outer envelope pore 16- chloroplastic mitochondrial [Chlorella sorokiniana]|uniref:Outer envelope pore 16-chloroplastic mitochondrial n=1 Tax=Chlorella sorokiniana TaxID=3076 RepID=A0A2P6TJZ2_CHLSO|nr:outer envelope pore 16- chloroplastic mitochondrial [Chlorella sorokiniana]|eukprot:PRW44391.1 outer envelope pore 16- chloroplastic mitochondrial [Chlorella sorokiniana]
MSLPVEVHEQSWPSRIGAGVGVGFAAGALTGAVASNWGDIKVPSAWPALVRTGSQMAQYGTTLALVGGTFATVDCFVESARGKKDAWNGVLAGAASGAALGLRIGSLPAAVKAAAALALASAVVDLTGGRLVGKGLVDDGATPPRRIYPYTS